MDNPKGIFYSKDHEWVKMEDGVATIGITDFAQHQLTDIVFIELPTAGKKAEQHKQIAVIESVKSVSDVFSPVSLGISIVLFIIIALFNTCTGMIPALHPVVTLTPGGVTATGQTQECRYVALRPPHCLLFPADPPSCTSPGHRRRQRL